MRKVLTMLFPLLMAGALAGQQTMSNDSVIKMAKSGLSDEIIITTISASAGQYSTTPDALIALKQAGVDDKVIAAIVSKGTVVSNPSGSMQGQPSPSPAATDVPPASGNRPRVYLQSASKGNNWASARDQSMEMSKDFEKDCSDVRITINQQGADYTVLLNHIEVGFSRDNQVQIADRNGDLLSRTKEGGSIRGGMKKACALILSDWTKKAN